MEYKYYELYNYAKKLFIDNFQEKLIKNAETNRNFLLNYHFSKDQEYFPTLHDFQNIKLHRLDYLEPFWSICENKYWYEVKNFYSLQDGHAVLLLIYPGMYPSYGLWMPEENYKIDLDFYFNLEQLHKISNVEDRLKNLKVLLWDYTNPNT